VSWIDDIPRYRDAVEKEQAVRDAAFLPVCESIAGFDVQPLTLLDYIVLRRIKSPLIADLKTSPEQLAQFLWRLNPDYQPTPCRAKKKFMRRCRQFFPPDRRWFLTKRRWRRKVREQYYNFSATLKAAREFMAETMMDRPAIKSSMVGQDEPEYFSDAASLCALFAREYKWAEEQTLSRPLKRIFQYLNEIKRHNGSKVLFNPSDRVKADWLLEVNRQGGAN
jgi:hypothetical protein